MDRTPWTGEPYAAWQQWKSEVLAKGILTNYTRIDLHSAEDAGYPAADIEFTWDGRSNQRMHGVDRHAIALDGGRYAVFVAIPAGDWDTSQDQVNAFLDTFQP